MATFESILLLLIGAVALSALARKLKAPYPALLALAGAGLALAPVAPPFKLDPALALALFVAPVLLDAAYDASLRDLRANWIPLTGLVFFAVGVTTVAVAIVARALQPDLPWAAAIALGAIVAPPDAAATSAILRQTSLPHRLTMVLQGESLLNDASALLVYRLAVLAAAGGGALSLQAAAPAFLLSVVGSVIVGPLAALAYLRLTRGLNDIASAVVTQFVGTFGMWIVAERLGLSPILTLVAYGVAVGRFAPGRTPARLRVPSYAVWDTAVLVLNALAFILIGLQLRPILASAPARELWQWALFAGAVTATVILARFGWVMSFNSTVRFKNAQWGVRLAPEMAKPTWQGGLVISWSGMRGIVTLAAALALPEGFPHRDLLLFTAFAVTLATLVIQGLTLRPLLLALALPDDHVVDREVRRARVALAEAGRESLADEEGPEAEALRRDLDEQRRVACAARDGHGRPDLRSDALRGVTLKRRRERLLQLRSEGAIGDDAFHLLEEELDFADLGTGSGL